MKNLVSSADEHELDEFSGISMPETTFDRPDQVLASFFKLKIDEVFTRFRERANKESAVHGTPHSVEGGLGDGHFLYIPGQRENRVVLVSHADTVWDDNPGYPPTLGYSEGRIYSTTPELGIGADDRSGVAALWALWDLGHSILLTSGEEQGNIRGEEKGMVAARVIMSDYPELAETLNKHQFMVELDREGNDNFKTYTVGTPEFCEYVQKQTCFFEPDKKYWTDIKVLCDKICGANLSIGYYNDETPSEQQDIRDWKDIVRKVRGWLGKTSLPSFPRGR